MKNVDGKKIESNASGKKNVNNFTKRKKWRKSLKSCRITWSLTKGHIFCMKRRRHRLAVVCNYYTRKAVLPVAAGRARSDAIDSARKMPAGARGVYRCRSALPLAAKLLFEKSLTSPSRHRRFRCKIMPTKYQTPLLLHHEKEEKNRLKITRKSKWNKIKPWTKINTQIMTCDSQLYHHTPQQRRRVYKYKNN